MKQIRKRLTYANVMSTVAVFLVLGGATALAAGLGKNTVGAKQLKKNAVTTAKVKNAAINAAKLAAGSVGATQLGSAAVTNEKLAANAVGSTNLANNAVTSTKIADKAVETGKLADGSVTTEKLTESERSQAFLAEVATSSAELAHPLAESPTSLVTLTLPANGKYVVTGETEFIRTTGSTGYSECFLSDNGTQIATMSNSYEAGVLFPSGGVSVTGISNGGGNVVLSCKSSVASTFGFERKLIATRVGSVN